MSATSIPQLLPSQLHHTKAIAQWDHIYYGDNMEEKEQDTIRISTSNPNGLRVHQIAPFTAAALEREVDIQGISEHNLDTFKYHINTRAQQQVRQISPTARAHFSQSTTDTLSDYKPGGTGIITFGTHTGRIQKAMMDPLGRWTTIRYSGTAGRDLIVINVYQCRVPTNDDGRATWHQQRSMLYLLEREDTNPRHNFLTDLNTHIQELQTTTNNEIIVMGDFNETMGGSSNLQKLCNANRLSDVYLSRHPESFQLRTQDRGSSRIDCMVATSGVIKALRKIQYEPFLSRYKGDHRALTADFSIQELLGVPSTPHTKQTRGIYSHDPVNVTTYINHVFEHLNNQNLFERSEALWNTELPDIALANSLDRQIDIACTVGSAACIPRERAYFVKRIPKLRRELSLLRRLHRRHVLHKTTATIQHALETASIEVPEFCDLPKIIAKKSEELTQLILHRKDERIQEQKEMAEAFELRGDKNAASAIRTIRATEHKRRTFDMFRNIRKGQQTNHSIDRIRIPKSWPSPHLITPQTVLQDPKTIDPLNSTEWIEITTPKDVEHYLMIRNRRHFGQAEGTPFTAPKFKTRFDWKASSQEAELVLDGQYDTQEIEDIASLFLDNCRRISPGDDLPPYLTMTQFKGKIKAWKESTTTSPSGRHLGHYKALFARTDPALNPQESKTVQEKQKMIASLYLRMINYAIKHEFSYDRWKNVTNVMIYKEPSNINIHRLRVIHIYEADLNLLLGVKWREALQNADDHDLIHPGQFGGRPGRQATTLTLMEELRFDYARSTREAQAQVDEDAEACYDRILPQIASITSRQHKIHKKVVIVHATTLEEAKFRLKTTHNVSDEFYQHCQAYPIYGTGQGSGNSPIAWCFISSVLFFCHEQRAHGATFRSADGSLIIRVTMLGFVDDTTCCTSLGLTEKPTVSQLLQRLEYDAQLWHDLLWVSGGKLNIPKCSFHLISFSFQTDGTPIMISNIKDDITVRDSTGNHLKIKYRPPTATHKTLGHFKAPMDDGHTTFDYLVKRGQTLTAALIRSPASPSEALTFVTSILIPSLCYSMPQSSLTSTQHRKLASLIMPKVFAKCGYNRYTARAVLYGPKRYGGASFLPFEVYDGVGKILNFLKLWKTPWSMEGKLLRITYSWMQFQSGFSQSYMTHQLPDPHVEAHWLKSLRTFLINIEATIELHSDFTPTIYRTTDHTIMDMATSDHTCTKTDIRRINYCRLYLGVTWLSEICDPTGHFILQEFLSGDRPLWAFRPTRLQVHQQRPGTVSWQIFRKFLKRHTLSGFRIHHPGTWVAPISEGTWDSYYDSDQLYVRIDTKWFQCHRDAQADDFSRLVPTQWLPTSQSRPALVAEVSAGQYHLFRKSHVRALPVQSNRYQSPQSSLSGGTFHEYVAAVIPEAFDVLGNFTMRTTIDVILTTMMSNSSILAVSDGSVIDFCMSFGWVVGTTKGQTLISSLGPAYGHGTSHRAEATGIRSVSKFLATLLQYYRVQCPSVRFIADNEAIINTCTKRQEYDKPYANVTLQSDYDLVEEIMTNISESGVVASFEWIQSHQDATSSITDLPWEARFNIEADKLASEYQRRHKQYRPRVIPNPTNHAILNIRGCSVTAQYKETIQRAATEPAYIQYLQKKFRWSDRILSLVDWDIIPLTITKLGGTSPTVVKIMNGLLPTNSALVRIKQREDPYCPLCGEVEDEEHIYRCSHQTRIEWKRKTISTIRQFCDKTESDDYFKETICTCITQWFDTGTVTLPSHLQRYNIPVTDQENIGWIQLFRGRWATTWKSTHTKHYAGTRRYDSRSWISNLSKIFLDAAKELWIQRNHDIHGHDATERNRRLHQVVTAEITRWSERKHEMCPIHREIIPSDTTTFCASRDTTILDAWIRQWRPVFKKSICDAKRMSVTNNSSIRHFFQPRKEKPIASSHPSSRRKPTTEPVPTFTQRHMTSFISIRRRRPRHATAATNITFFPQLQQTDMTQHFYHRTQSPNHE